MWSLHPFRNAASGFSKLNILRNTRKFPFDRLHRTKSWTNQSKLLWQNAITFNTHNLKESFIMSPLIVEAGVCSHNKILGFEAFVSMQRTWRLHNCLSLPHDTDCILLNIQRDMPNIYACKRFYWHHCKTLFAGTTLSYPCLEYFK